MSDGTSDEDVRTLLSSELQAHEPEKGPGSVRRTAVLKAQPHSLAVRSPDASLGTSQAALGHKQDSVPEALRTLLGRLTKLACALWVRCFRVRVSNVGTCPVGWSRGPRSQETQ